MAAQYRWLSNWVQVKAHVRRRLAAWTRRFYFVWMICAWHDRSRFSDHLMTNKNPFIFILLPIICAKSIWSMPVAHGGSAYTHEKVSPIFAQRKNCRKSDTNNSDISRNRNSLVNWKFTESTRRRRQKRQRNNTDAGDSPNRCEFGYAKHKPDFTHSETAEVCMWKCKYRVRTLSWKNYWIQHTKIWMQWNGIGSIPCHRMPASHTHTPIRAPIEGSSYMHAKYNGQRETERGIEFWIRVRVCSQTFSNAVFKLSIANSPRIKWNREETRNETNERYIFKEANIFTNCRSRWIHKFLSLSFLHVPCECERNRKHMHFEFRLNFGRENIQKIHIPVFGRRNDENENKISMILNSDFIIYCHYVWMFIKISFCPVFVCFLWKWIFVGVDTAPIFMDDVVIISNTNLLFRRLRSNEREGDRQ